MVSTNPAWDVFFTIEDANQKILLIVDEFEIRGGMMNDDGALHAILFPIKINIVIPS